jgi:hypothetical protein
VLITQAGISQTTNIMWTVGTTLQMGGKAPAIFSWFHHYLS